MKNIKIYLSLLLLPLLGLASCTGDFEQPPVILPEGGVGTGVWNNPMSCYQANLGAVNDDLNEVWVTGYIVGWINTDISNVMKAEVAMTTVPATVATNMLMAADPKETDWEKMVTVQLPSGKVRNALNLKDHPENLGVEVTIKGTTGSKYCGAYGVRSVSDYNFGPEGKDDGTPGTPDNPSGSETAIYSALSGTSATGADGWKYEIVSNPANLEYIWAWKDYNGSYYLNASAYANSSANASEAYAVSPEISLEGYKSVSMTFEHAAKFQTTLRTLCGVCVREAGSSSWTAVNVPVWPEAGSWTFVSAGSLNLSAFAGKKVQVAFKYASSSAGADTWEIKNLKVSGIK